MEGYTFAKKNTVEFQWKITGVSSYLKINNNEEAKFISSKFSTGSEIGDNWKIKIYFNDGNTPKRPKNNISIYLYNVSDNAVTVKATFFISNTKRDKFFAKNLEKKIQSTKNQGFPKFLEKQKLLNNLSNFAPNDTLTVCADLTVYDNVQAIPINKLCNPSKNQLASDLGKLYESKDNSDVTIIVGDKKFQAHKAILCARSPVLAAMFTHDMIEKKSNEVSVIGIDPKIFEVVLKYIYTDQVSDLDDVAAGVLEVADMYQLQSLKEICEEEFMKSLNRDNIINTMVLANRHNATNLKNYVDECVMVDAAEIIKTDHFKALETSNPSLALELFKKVAIKKIDYKSTVTQTN